MSMEDVARLGRHWGAQGAFILRALRGVASAGLLEKNIQLCETFEPIVAPLPEIEGNPIT